MINYNLFLTIIILRNLHSFHPTLLSIFIICTPISQHLSTSTHQILTFMKLMTSSIISTILHTQTKINNIVILILIHQKLSPSIIPSGNTILTFTHNSLTLLSTKISFSQSLTLKTLPILLSLWQSSTSIRSFLWIKIITFP